jgi:hypothetical protein
MVKTDTVIKEHQTSIFWSDKSKNQGYHIEDVQFVTHFFFGLINLSHIYYWCFLPPSGVCDLRFWLPCLSPTFGILTLKYFKII